MSLLQIENMSHHFGGLCALNDFKVTLEPGDFMGLIGPNGAGKTTVFNLVSGFYQPSDGKISYKGKALTGLKPHKVTSLGIARTFQNIRLWKDMNVLDNIRIAQHYNLGYSLFDSFMRTKRYINCEKQIKKSSLDILESLDLIKYVDELPKNLPYGIQRRVEIARALSLKPDLLLLDEPAAGLSSADIQDLITLIKWIHKEFNMTIWMIEHQMVVVMSLCSMIKVIDFGATIAQGTPDQIQKNPEVIKAYLGNEDI